MLAQQLLCMMCVVWLGAGANIVGDQRNGKELRQGDIPGRVFRPVIPRSPPVRVTNAHAGVELLDENVAAVNERRRKLASPPNTKKRPLRRARVRRPVSRRRSSGPFPAESSVNHRFARKIVEGTLKNVRSGARLISARGNFNVPLVNKLIDNATLIRENIVEGFSCDGRIYGYYADQLNECQIFHICVPMKQMFPNRFTEQDVYHFSFICPQYTIFSQDSMVCAWSQSAVPCSEAHHLYDMNKNFFVVSNDVPKEPPPGGYPSAGVNPGASGSSGNLPLYPGQGSASVNPAPSPVAVPSPYPVQSGSSVGAATVAPGVPPAYPASGGAPIGVPPAPASIPPAYPGSGAAAVNPAPISTGTVPTSPGSGGATSPAGVPPAYPASGGASVSPSTSPAGVPPAYPAPGGTSGSPNAGAAGNTDAGETPVNPAPPPTSVSPGYPSTSEVDQVFGSGAPLPNSRPIGDGGASSSTDGVSETTAGPQTGSGSDLSSTDADPNAPLSNSKPLATIYNPDSESASSTDEPSASV